MRGLISETDDGFVLSLTDMQLSRGVITDEEYAAVREMISEIIGKNLPRKLSDLAVDGKTLMSVRIMRARTSDMSLQGCLTM